MEDYEYFLFFQNKIYKRRKVMATTKKTTTTKTTTKPASKSSTTKTTKPAETKTTTTTTTTTSSSKSKSSSRKSGVFAWGLNKLSMYTIVAVALLYAISMVLSLCGVSLKVVSALQGLATAVMICIVAYLAWKYVARKETVWKVLYIICLCLVLAGIVIPLIK